MNKQLGLTGYPADMISINTASDCSVIIYVDDKRLGLDKSNAIIGLLTNELLSKRLSWLREYIPSYTSLLIEFSLFDTDHLCVNAFLKSLINDSLSHIGEMIEGNQSHGMGANENLRDTLSDSLDDGLGDVSAAQHQATLRNPMRVHAKVHRIPVCYELSSRESDLAKVASDKKLSEKDLIALHCSVHYRVFATGFLPGFAYLGELPEALSQPRLEKPRLKVPKGAVAIADRQTAIYPDESPGGWHILGYTPVPLLCSQNNVQPLLKTGDYVEFYAISESEYNHRIGA